MTIKLKYNKERFILFAILALCIFSCLILPGMITMLLSVLAMGYMAVAEKNALVKKNKMDYINNKSYADPMDFDVAFYCTFIDLQFENNLAINR